MLDNHNQSLFILEMHSNIDPERGGSSGRRRAGVRALVENFSLWAPSIVLALAIQSVARGQESETTPAPEPTSPDTSTTTVQPTPTPAPQEPGPVSAVGNAETASSMPIEGTSQLGLALAGPGLILPGQAFLNWGLLHLSAYVGYQVSYGNGLQSAPGQLSDTVINLVSPGVSLKLGDHWTLSYSPTLIYYSGSHFRNEIDQGLSLHGTTSYKDWNFDLSQGYGTSSQPLIETAGQTSQQVLSTALNASHQMSSRVSLDMGASQVFRFVDQGSGATQFADTREWSETTGLSYRWAPRFSTGINMGFIYDTIARSPDMASEQLQGTMSWQAGRRLGLHLSAGADYRQFLGSGVPNLLSPVYAVSASYQLFEPTSFYLSAAGGVSPSYFANSASQSTTLSFGLHQRLLHRFQFTAAGGYSTTSYQTTVATTTTTPGNYDSVSFNVSMGTTILKRAGASIFYQETFVSQSGASAVAGLFNYTTRTVGLSLHYQF